MAAEPNPNVAPQSSRVGVIGMGTMGSPMAINLIRAGFAVTVFNRTPEKCAAAVREGARQAGSVGELASGTDIVLIMLSDAGAVQEVSLGEDGILAKGRPGMLVIDSSTISPAASKELGASYAAKGMSFLDAPVTGSRPQAETGKLFFLVGGSESAYKQAIPLFDAMGRRHIHLGENGMGGCAKICNNMAGLVNLSAFCEALAMAGAFGLDQKKLCEVIGDSGGRSAVSDGKGPKILEQNWRADFALELAHKDLALSRDFAQSLHAASPVVAQAAEVYRLAKEAGFGGDDVCGLYRWYHNQASQ